MYPFGVHSDRRLSLSIHRMLVVLLSSTPFSMLYAQPCHNIVYLSMNYLNANSRTNGWTSTDAQRKHVLIWMHDQIHVSFSLTLRHSICEPSFFPHNLGGPTQMYYSGSSVREIIIYNSTAIHGQRCPINKLNLIFQPEKCSILKAEQCLPHFVLNVYAWKLNLLRKLNWTHTCSLN